MKKIFCNERFTKGEEEMRKRYLRRILAMILSMLMIIGTVPTSVFAEGTTESAENEEGTEDAQTEESVSDETENLENEVRDEITEDKEENETQEESEEELSNEETADLLYSSGEHTRDDAVKWAYAQEGKYLDYDKAYGAQCVDLIKYYYAYFGKASYARGNGCDYVSNALPAGWTRIKNTADFVPQPGDIAVWGTELSKYGHVAIILSANVHSFVSMDQNWPSGSACKQVTHTYSKFWGVIRPNFSSVANNPIGQADSAGGGALIVSGAGWAFDADDLSAALEIHVYLDSTFVGKTIANLSRDDVNKAYGCGPNHGYGFEIKVGKEFVGRHVLNIYAINVGGGANVLLRSLEVNIADANNPVGQADSIGGGIYSVGSSGWAFDPDDTSAALEIQAYLDDKMIGKTVANLSRDDVNKAYGCGSNHGYGFEIQVGKEFVGTHTLSVYAINVGGGDNTLLRSESVNIGEDTKGPEISDCKIGDITADGYTITCKVTDENGVDRVQFPTWTEYNGQDDLSGDWATNSAFSGTINGDTFSYRVKASDHNNERGVYITHIYAYDKYGNANAIKMDNVTMLELPQATTELGDDFYAEVQNATTRTVLTKVNPEKFDAYFQEKDDTLRTQIWHFVRNKNEDSYTISCEENEALVLDVEDGLDKNNNNVRVWTRNGSNAQKWKILEKNGNYYLQPLSSKLRVLDTPNALKEGTSAQISVYNESGICGMRIIKTEPIETKLEDSKIVATASYKGHSYQIFDQGMSWSDAKRACELLGGHLVTITDSEEQAFVEKLLEDNNASMNQYWLGMFRYKQSYAWVTGENSDYTNWDSGEPNGVVDDYPSEYCVQLLNKVEENRRFKWNDKNNSNSETNSVGFYGKNKSGVICEFETLKEYTLSYNANGGSSAPEKEVKAQGTELTISSKKPTREGYNFIGWATKADATKAEYQAGDKYTLNGNITFYAVWEKAIGGTCGKEVTWSLGDDGILTISGTGDMKNYTYKSEMPWYKYISQIKNVVIKEGVTSIGDYVFYGMTGLTKVTIPKGITSVGAFAFKNCTSLDGVQLPTTLKKLGESAFFGCSSLTEIAIPEGLYTVWGYTFKNCTKLEKVTFPSTLVKIGEAAFYGCSSLKTLTIPDNVSIIGIYCFKNCTSLSSVQLSANIQQIREAVFYGTAITELKVPDKVTSIGAYAFKNCTKLKNVTFSKNLTKIDDSAFYACSGLTVLNLPDSLTDIKDYAFRKCTELKNVNFSAGLKTVGESSFYGCEKLTELNLPEGVTDIKGYAFKGCIGVTTITLPSTLKTMGESAFYGCTGISKIEIPKNVSTVGAYAFSRCSKLSEVVFKGNAPIIGNYAFAKVTAKVGYPSGNTTWNKEKQQNYGGTLTWSQTK